MAKKPRKPQSSPLDAYLAQRMQSDMNGFIETYQEIIDNRVAKYAKELAPTYGRARRYIDQQVKEMYAKYADAEGKLDGSRLDQLQRLQYLRKMVTQLQQGATGQKDQLDNTLPYQYSEAYYFHAFGLEQATKLAVTVPLLTEAQVMGVIANPWLPDGRTYSDRIRASTSFLASKMQVAVEEAVTTGMSIRDTAMRIQEIAGEGYSNAVRLARTEINRAAGQGASQLFMQNADILDGKRWNATLDSRTAPKDAANDGKIYPLEYDTSEMPGVAGERIPNHPNCRCKWSPFISYLGVQNKGRIARGDGDTINNFGERIYTKAETYRDYAKERGLPDLDERLAKDNDRSYLRRGETSAAFGTSVSRDRRDFIPAAATAGATAVVAATFGERIKERLAQGTGSETQVTAIGTEIRQEIESWMGTLRQEVESLEQQMSEAESKMDAAFKANNLDESDKWAREWTRLDGEHASKIKLLRGDRRNVVRSVLSEIRSFGPAEMQTWAKGSSQKVREAIGNAAEYLPTDWLEKSRETPLLGKHVKRGYYRGATSKEPAHMALSGNNSRALMRVALHEMGHRFENVVPGIKALEYEFYQRRTKGEALAWLGPGYDKKEVTRRDNFLSPYMGKDHGNTANSYYELLSMGLEAIFEGSYPIENDPDFYDFILGVLVSR